MLLPSHLWIFYFLNFIVFDCDGSSLLHIGFLSLQRWGLLFDVVCRLLIAVASLVAEHRLQYYNAWAQ